MSEVAPTDLVRKRNEAAIATFQATLVNQELQVLEKYEEIRKLEENIEATREQIRRKQENIDALDNPSHSRGDAKSTKRSEEVTDG